MLALLGISGVMLLLALVPERFGTVGAAGKAIVRARVALAAVGIGVFVGLIVPVLAEALA
jgi:hypothetical protein